jgi:hypothetical protein
MIGVWDKMGWQNMTWSTKDRGYRDGESFFADVVHE